MWKIALFGRVEHGDGDDEVHEIHDHEEIVDEVAIVKRQALINYLYQLDNS
jgi:hypothetical protein